MSKGFSDEYYKHYGSFSEEITEYKDPENRLIGNGDIPKVMYDFYKFLYNKKPKSYVDLGCGTGEEMVFYKNKRCSVSGCDFSDYCIKNINEKVSDFIQNIDSLSFMNALDYKADILWENTLQYLEDKDFDNLLTLISDKTSKGAVLGILYDHTKRIHPYRKQVHLFSWWEKKLNDFGFVSSKRVVRLFKNYRKFFNDYGMYIFVKKDFTLIKKDYDCEDFYKL